MALPEPKPGILDVKPYVGGEGRGATGRLVRLASNENPLGCSDKARAAYLKGVDELHRYPDGAVTDLRGALSSAYKMPTDQIVCGAGSDELISLLFRAYVGAGDEVVHSAHGFLMYPINAKLVGAKAIAAPEVHLRSDIKALLAAVTGKTKVMILANPNNPTGSYLTKTELRQLRDQLRSDVLLVIDAAYAEYVDAPDYECGRAMVDEYKNVVTLRTFSKIHGLAALRLGWGYFPPAIADVVNRVRGPFNVSVPAQMAGIAALQDKDFMQQSIDIATKGRAFLIPALEAMGLKVYPAVANFILVEFGSRAEEVRLALKDRGIFIRQMGAYHLPTCLRITVGTTEDNQLLLAGLRAVL